MNTNPATTATPAEQAKALLAYAADDTHFYEPITWAGSRMARLRGDRCSETAMYAAQAATAHALLAISGELAQLREQVHELRAVRVDLADIASAVRGLAGAVVTSATQTADVANQLEELATAVDKGLIDVARETAHIAAAIDDHGNRRWSWRNLFRRRRPAEGTVAGDGAVPEVEPGSDLGVCA